MFWKKHPYKRKYKFIDKKQQVRFAVDIALHSLLFPIFFLLLTITPISTVLVREEARNTPLLREFFGFCWDHWWVVLLALAFVGYFSILFSHRIFGPIRRFENALVARKGDSTSKLSCNLRAGDYFHDFSHLLEDVLNRDVVDSKDTSSGDAAKSA